jgi:ERCC4-type nuclease
MSAEKDKKPFNETGFGKFLNKAGKHIAFMPIFFERKSLGDLYGTLGKGMERFKAEMSRAHENGHRLILIVEACFAQDKNGYEHSTMEGVSIL